MKKIKVLYIVTRCMKSGPIQVIDNIMRYIDKEKFEIYLISINPELPNRTLLDYLKKNTIYKYVPISKKDVILGRTHRVIEEIDKIKPDVIHSTGVVPDFLIGQKYSNKQVIIAHCNDKVDFVYMYGKIVGSIMATVHFCNMKKARLTVACSKSLADIYEIKGLKIPYIRNGVLYKEENATYSKKEFREKLSLPENKKIYIYAASFNNRKNHRFLLETFTNGTSFYYDKLLLLLGDGPTYESLKTEFSTKDEVLFVGRVYNVKDYLQASDYFISSSLQEGMPMGVLEAMAEGLPVILSDIPQHKEIVDIDKNVGVLYENNNTCSLSNAIELCEKLDREKSRIAAKTVVKNNYSAERMSQAYQEYYEKIAGEKVEE